MIEDLDPNCAFHNAHCSDPNIFILIPSGSVMATIVHPYRSNRANFEMASIADRIQLEIVFKY